MATFEESFLYPLVLLLIGAGVSGVLVGWLTNRWQDRRKEREFEVDIASKMTEIKSYIIGEAASLSRKRKDTLTADDKDARYEKENKWFVDINIIRSKLESYFPETGIKERWDDYCVVLKAVYDVSWHYYSLERAENFGGGDLKYYLEVIRKYFSDTKEIEWDSLTPDMPFPSRLWGNVTITVAIRGDELIKDLLKLQVKPF